MDITAIAARLSRIADALQALQVWRELTLDEFLADSIIQLEEYAHHVAQYLDKNY